MIKEIKIKDKRLYIEIQQTESTSITTSMPLAEGLTLLNKLKSVLMKSNEKFISFSGIKTKEELKSCFPDDYENIEKLFCTDKD